MNSNYQLKHLQSEQIISFLTIKEKIFKLNLKIIIILSEKLMEVLERSLIEDEILEKLGIKEKNFGASTGVEWLSTSDQGELKISSPTNGKLIAQVYQASEDDYEKIIKTAEEAFIGWRKTPAPKRGEIVRQIGLKLRENKESLGALVSYEMGKSYQEGLGEVQEMIDICDFAVGLSRQLYGFTMHSERTNHRMYDQYHPLGIVATISAFNFPGSCLGMECNDSCSLRKC
jgi:aldehyde dehydrogenase (NAD+)